MGQRIGEMKCLNPACSCTDVAVEVTSAGTWQAKCHKCQLPTYGKAGTPWRRQMEKLVKLDEPNEPAAPPPKPASKPAANPIEQPPTPKPARSVFDLANLR